jgi:hypothetical protein
MRAKLAATAATIFSVLAFPAWAETTTMRTNVEAEFHAGVLDACTIGFDVVRRDFQGARALVTGSLTYFSFGMVGLKVGVKGAAGPRQAPATAYLIHDLKTNASDLLPAEEPDPEGFGLFAFRQNDPTMAALIEAIAVSRFEFAYTLGDDKQGAKVQVDMTIKDRREDGAVIADHTAARRFGECMKALVDAQMKRK